MPLTVQALAVLDTVRIGNTSPDALIFPGAKKGKPMSDQTMDSLLARMKVDATPQGFRSTFRNWAGDETDHAREVAEAEARAELLEALSCGTVTADDVRSAPVAEYPVTLTIKAIWSAWELAQYGPGGRSGDEPPANPQKPRPTLLGRIFGRRAGRE